MLESQVYINYTTKVNTYDMGFKSHTLQWESWQSTMLRHPRAHIELALHLPITSPKMEKGLFYWLGNVKVHSCLKHEVVVHQGDHLSPFIADFGRGPWRRNYWEKVPLRIPQQCHSIFYHTSGNIADCLCSISRETPALAFFMLLTVMELCASQTLLNLVSFTFFYLFIYFLFGYINFICGDIFVFYRLVCI